MASTTGFLRDPAVPDRLRLPLLAGLREEIVPVLAVLWVVIVGAFVVSGRDWLWPVGVWASVTITMLWPVGRRLGRPYFSYRRPAFVIAVLTMASIPLAGFALTSDWSFAARSTVFFGLVAVLTGFGIVAALPWAHGRPIEMFFRPDILFGDGRILATGILSTVFGIRYLFGPQPADQLWALPAWDWYGILLAMVAGLIPTIAGRGMVKLVLRMQRVLHGRAFGWGFGTMRELLLVATMLGIAYGFAHAFMGRPPFTIPLRTDDAVFWQTLAVMVAAALWMVVVRGSYKRRIGEPFIRETVAQSAVKHLLLVVALGPFFYAFMSMLHGRWLESNTGYPFLIGAVGFAWGVVMLTVFRVVGQRYQARAVIQQMAAVLLPHQPPDLRQRAIGMMFEALLAMPDSTRREHLRAMNEGLAVASEEARSVMTAVMVERLAALPPPDRTRMMRSQAAALGAMPQQERMVRMGDMMSAVAALPEEQRRVVMTEMTALMG